MKSFNEKDELFEDFVQNAISLGAEVEVMDLPDGGCLVSYHFEGQPFLEDWPLFGLGRWFHGQRLQKGH